MPKAKKDTDNKKEYVKKSTLVTKKIAKVKKLVKKPLKEKVWALGNNRYAKVHESRGSVHVDLRCYDLKNGDLRPGKAGISLDMKQWGKFIKCMDEINAAAKAMNEE